MPGLGSPRRCREEPGVVRLGIGHWRRCCRGLVPAKSNSRSVEQEQEQEQEQEHARSAVANAR
jgi:hypothetical protein